MKGGFWMIRTIKSGKVIEKSQFYVGEKKPRARRRKGSSTLAKKDSNLRLAERRLAQTINCNFAAGDLFITLTYDEEHMQALGEDPVKGAEAAFGLFLRRLGRELGKIAIKPAFVWITADKDQDTLEPVRLHHHLIIKRAGFEVKRSGAKLEDVKIGGRKLEEIWRQGICYAEELAEQDDYLPLAVYMVRQAVNAPDAKKWHPARGLAKPEIKSEIIVARAHELRAPGGADVKEIGHYDIETGSHYIRYVVPQGGRKGKDEKGKAKDRGTAGRGAPAV